VTYLTIKERCATYPLDQLLAARRRGVAICLICGDESTPIRETVCGECLYGTGALLRDPEDIIAMNWGCQCL
jgi:ribosomal protein L37E